MPVAIMDIGSNAVRFVVFDACDRAPFKIHNERVQCHLGKGLAKTGYLNPAGVVLAFEAVGRFAALAKTMKVKSLQAVATAALRDAKDGADFIAGVKKAFGLTIRIVSGEEEARLSAQGALMNRAREQGGHCIIGDFGGGSLELIALKAGRVTDKASFPMGAHRLQAMGGKSAQTAAIDAMLQTAPFLKKHKGADFYAIGGAWRSIGKAHMALARHPLHMLDQYAVEGRAAEDFAAMLSRQSTAQLQKKLGGMEKRLHDMGVAALAMARAFRVVRPARLVFSGTGLREGLIYDALSPAQKKEDGLIASAAKISENAAAYAPLADFILPLFAKDAHRLVRAAALLSDICRLEHEDAQATVARVRAQALPLYGIDHAGRAFLATALAVRYGEKPQADALEGVRALMDEEEQAHAVATGHALALAHLLTGGNLAALKDAKLQATPRALKMTLTGAACALQAENVDAALALLAGALGRRSEVAFG